MEGMMLIQLVDLDKKEGLLKVYWGYTTCLQSHDYVKYYYALSLECLAQQSGSVQLIQLYLISYI